MKKKFDVLALGGVAVDDLLFTAGYPPPDDKAEVLRRERQCGGISAIAIITAARLGCNCAYAGVLGRDELSDYAAAQLRREGVNVRHMARREGVKPIHSVIVIDTNRGSRNIFFDVSGVMGADRGWPPAAVIESARVLYADWFSVPGMVRACRIARRAGISIVADFEQPGARGFSALFDLPDHLIVSASFAARVTGTSEPKKALQKLWKKRRQLVAVTAGEKGCWYLSAEEPGRVRHQPAFRVPVVDTTGCGDVFHGAYAAALARGKNVRERMEFAAAAAALKAARPGAQKGIPTWPETEKFLRRARSI